MNCGRCGCFSWAFLVGLCLIGQAAADEFIPMKRDALSDEEWAAVIADLDAFGTTTEEFIVDRGDAATVEDARRVMRSRVYSARFDADSNGTDEVFVFLWLPAYCGTMGCPTPVYERRGDRWVPVWEIYVTDAEDSLCLSELTWNGFPVIYSWTDAMWWDGSEYHVIWSFGALEGEFEESSYTADEVDLRRRLLARGFCPGADAASGDDYRAYNPEGGGIGAFGRYQLRQPALVEAGFMNARREWTGNEGVNSAGDFLGNPRAQEIAFARFMQANRALLRVGPYGYANVGQRIVGANGTFSVSEAGMMAAAHSRGVGAVWAYLRHVGERGWISDQTTFGDDGDTFADIEQRLRDFEQIPFAKPLAVPPRPPASRRAAGN